MGRGRGRERERRGTLEGWSELSNGDDDILCLQLIDTLKRVEPEQVGTNSEDFVCAFDSSGLGEQRLALSALRRLGWRHGRRDVGPHSFCGALLRRGRAPLRSASNNKGNKQ